MEDSLLNLVPTPSVDVALGLVLDDSILPLFRDSESFKEETNLSAIKQGQRLPVLKEWLTRNGFVEIEAKIKKHENTTWFMHEKYAIHLSLSGNDEKLFMYTVRSAFKAFPGEKGEWLDRTFSNHNKSLLVKNKRFALSSGSEYMRAFSSDGGEYKTVSFYSASPSMVLDDSTENIVQFLQNIRLLECLAEPLTHQAVHQLSFSPSQEQLVDFGDLQWFDGFYSTPLCVGNAIQTSYCLEGIINHMQPSFAYIEEPIELKKLEKIQGWLPYMIHEASDKVDMPAPETWFPLKGADGLPHVLLKEASEPSAFLKVLERATPEQVQEWMGPSRPGTIHIPLEFMERFAKEHDVDNFMRIIDSKMNRKDICWEHGDKSLLTIFISSTGFVHRHEKGDSSSYTKAWKVLEKIDPTFQCLLTQREFLPGRPQAESIHQFEINESGISAQFKKAAIQPSCDTPYKDNDDFMWEIRPVSSLQNLVGVFQEFIKKEEFPSIKVHIQGFSAYSELFLSQYLLEKELSQDLIEAKPQTPVLSINKRF